MVNSRKFSLLGLFTFALAAALIAVVLVPRLGFFDGNPGPVNAAVSAANDESSEDDESSDGDDISGDNDQWWPSQWGPDDEAGASNWITPGKVKKAAKLIKKGDIYELGRAYEDGMPIPQVVPRSYSLIIKAEENTLGPTFGPFGDNMLVGNFEFVEGEIGQLGTQFDGLGHIGIQMGAPGDTDEMRYYNGFTQTEIFGAGGLQKLGIEEVTQFSRKGS